MSTEELVSLIEFIRYVLAEYSKSCPHSFSKFACSNFKSNFGWYGRTRWICSIPMLSAVLQGTFVWLRYHFSWMDSQRSSLSWQVQVMDRCYETVRVSRLYFLFAFGLEVWKRLRILFDFKIRKPPDTIGILVGTNDLKAGGIYYQAERYVIHESYNNPRLANDIAVLRVRGPITFTEKVQAIEYSSEEVPDGIILQLTGWSSLYVSVSCNNHSEDPKKRNYFCRKTIVHHNCYNSLNWTPFLRRNVWNCGMAVEFIKAIFVHSPKSAKEHAEWIFSSHSEMKNIDSGCF